MLRYLPHLFLVGLLAGLIRADCPPAEPAPPPGLIVELPPDELVPSTLTVRPLSEGRDWGHAKLNLQKLHAAGHRGAGVLVSVCDTGVDREHPDLRGAIQEVKDFTGSRSGAADVQGHGTHCSGIIASRSDDTTGLVGVAPECRLLHAKVLGDSGSGADIWIAGGIDWSVSRGARVISLSLGSSGRSPTIEAACQRAIQAGVIVVAAAGNDGPRENTVGYPGGGPGMVCVAATAENNTVANFSSRGRGVNIAAPGQSIESTLPGGRYGKMSGTSMACPYVSGCAALYVEACDRAKVKPSQAEFTKLMAETAQDYTPPGRDTSSGYGLIQPEKVLAKVAKPVDPVDPPPPDDLPNVIVFEEADFTPRGLEKLRLLNLKGYSFTTVKKKAESKKVEGNVEPKGVRK